MEERKLPKGMYFDVVEFHQKFGLIGCDTPGWGHNIRALYRRWDLIDEEFNELQQAFETKDLPALLDNLVDLVYVCFGMAYMLGLPFNEAWEEIHKTNMQKMAPRELQNETGDSPFEFKIAKPEGWKPPDIERILIAHGWKKGDEY